MDVDLQLERYLARLGIARRPPTTLEGLREVHRAHVARIPYDNLSIMLGRPERGSRGRGRPRRPGAAASATASSRTARSNGS